MSQHLIKEIQMLKQEVALLKEVEYPGPGAPGYKDPNEPIGQPRDPRDPRDVWAAINDLIKRVEDLEDRPKYFKPRNPRHVGR